MRPTQPPPGAKPKIAIVTREEEGVSLQDFLANRLRVTKRATVIADEGEKKGVKFYVPPALLRPRE